ncbi:MAG: hypothetical protein Q9174_002363 [Haloplaca sp. 1 TL-2023]
MGLGPPSALVGQPPMSDDDTLIVKGWQIYLGMKGADPSAGLKIGPKPPPPGVPHESKQTEIAIGCAVTMVLMALFTGTRLIIRATNRKLTWGKDDVAILIGTLLAMLIPIFYCYKLENAGNGKHLYDVTYWELTNHQTISRPALALFYVALAVIKISIILFYMRLTAFASRRWTIAHYIFIAFLVACAIITLVISFVSCDPPILGDIREMGRRGVKPVCYPLIYQIGAFNAWHIFSDCLLLVVPFLMLWRVQMKMVTKMKVCAAGLIGLANIGLAMARTINQAIFKPPSGFDTTYTSTGSFAYSAAELTLAIFTANLPVLSFVATKTVEKLSSIGLTRRNPSSGSNPTSHSPTTNRGMSVSRPFYFTRNGNSKTESETGLADITFVGERVQRGKEGFNPTVRHDVEYGDAESEEGCSYVRQGVPK